MRLTVLRMREAAFHSARVPAAGPFTLDVAAGERLEHRCAGDAEASMLAMLASGIARPTSGTVTIAEYETRIQPAQCKRVAVLVPHDPMPMNAAELEHHIRYRAALWNIDAAGALAHARLTLEKLRGVHRSFAYPLAAATISSPLLVVFDRPPNAYAEAMIAAVSPSAVLITRDVDPHA